MKYHRLHPCCKNIWACLFFWPHWQLFLSSAFSANVHLTSPCCRNRFSLLFPAALSAELPGPLSQSPSTKRFPFGESSATEKHQERAVKGPRAQKAMVLVHALSRASFSIGCPLHMKKEMVHLRVGEPDRGSSRGKCSSRACCDSSWAAALQRCSSLGKFSVSFGCQPARQPQSFCPSVYLYP